jgi:ubiquinone/menaquinone biosynthesis C-methylase UbiE
MATPPSSSGGSARPREGYSLGSRPEEQRRLEGRTAADRARPLLPHLRPGMRLLDVGCGPGSITVGLAEVVAPGEVVGLDIQPAQIERARALAAERGQGNARFETGDAYQLPFPDASFDAAFTNTLLSHLQEPLRALREMHRVLRPGGVLCAADIDTDSIIVAPPLPDVVAGLALFQRLRAYRRGATNDVRQRRAHLIAAGFDRVSGDAYLTVSGTPEATRQTARGFGTLLLAPDDVALAAEQGWANQEGIARMVAAWQAWGERPDAFYCQTTIAAVGWKAAATG